MINEYPTRITNEVREIKHTNQAKLLVFDHPNGTDVLLDKYGEVHTLTDPKDPHAAISLSRRQVGDAISERDGFSNMTETPLAMTG